MNIVLTNEYENAYALLIKGAVVGNLKIFSGSSKVTKEWYKIDFFANLYHSTILSNSATVGLRVISVMNIRHLPNLLDLDHQSQQ